MTPGIAAALPAQPAEVVDGAELWSKPARYRTTGTRDAGQPRARCSDDALPPWMSTLSPSSFSADRSALYGAWNALANLADLADRISVSVEAKGALDKAKLENGVLEPLRALGLIDD